ncbi:lamin tail domain-containing protein [Bacteroidota bacterium]
MKTKLTFFKKVVVFSMVLMLIGSFSFAQTIITIGTGTTVNTSSGYPTPFGNYYWGQRQQFLIPASEITAAGGGMGTISSVAFYVNTVNACPTLNNFSVKVGSVSATSYTSTTMVTSLTTVYTSSAFIVGGTGWRTIAFTTPFSWDGTSSVVVETCSNNSGWISSGNTQCRGTTLSYYGTLEHHADNAVNCTYTTGIREYLRPNIRLGITMGTPPQKDLGILSWDTPYSNCGMSATEPVTIKVKNWGLASQNSYSLRYSTNGGTSWTTQAMTTAILPGDTLTHTFTTTANFATAGTYNCKAEVILPLDSNANNNVLNTTVIATAGLATPYFEDFESYSTGVMTSGSWTSSTTSVPNWQIDVSNTSSSNTGPSGDHTLGTTAGKYAFTETSGGSLGSTTYLTSPCANFGNVNAVVMKFWYHMYGAAMGTLSVEQKVSGTWVATGWSKTAQQHSSMGAAWSEAVISINPAAEAIRFKGVRGSSFTSDMAVDDITVYIPMPNDLKMLEWAAPLSGTAPSTTMPITVKVFNAGLATQDTIPIKYSINGGTTWVTEVYNDSIVPGDTLTYTFTATANMATAGYYSCIGAVKNPGDGAASNDSVFANPYLCSSLTGSYLIGSSTSADFATFGDAVFALNNCGVSGAVVMNVETGTYTEQVEIGAINGASATNTITFKSLTGNNTDVVLQYASASSGAPWTVQLNAAEYITFKNMTILANGATYATVLDLTNANHNTFEGNILQSTGSVSSSYSRIAYIYTGLNNYNTLLNNTLIGGYYSIYCYGTNSTTWAKGNRFEGNDISGYYYYPMYVYYSDSVQIINNYIHGGLAPYDYGISCYYPNNGYRIIGNKLDLTSTGTSTTYGIRDYYGNYVSYNATPTGYGLIANNMVTISGGTGNHYGLYSYYCNGSEYYYNTIHMATGGTTSRCLYQYNTSSNTLGQTFKNNIFVNTSGSGYAAYFNTPTSVSASDYNVFYSNASSNFVYWSGNKTTLALLQTASSKDANSLSVLPAFAAYNDLHVNDPAIDGEGTPITGITTDIDGQARNATTPDIGADEFIVVYNEASLLSIDNPIAPCPAVASNVEVTLKNTGLVNLNTATIGWKVNGVTQTPYSFSGTILPANDTSLVIGTYTFAAGISYDIVAYSSLPNGVLDSNNTNDTAWAYSVVTAMPAGTYTIGPDTTDTWPSFTAAVNALVTNGVCGALVINVDSGTYNEQIEIPEILGASAVNTITFKSATGINTDVVLTYASSNSSAYWTVFLNGADYISFEDMTIAATGTYGRTVYLNSGANYNEFSGNLIQTVVSTSSNYYGIYNASGSNDEYNTFSDNVISGGYYSLYAYGSGSADLEYGNTYEDNEFIDYYYYGAYFYYQGDLNYKGNYVENASNSGTVYGPRFYYCDGTECVGNNINVHGTSTVYGVYMYYNDSSATRHGLFANNMIITSGGTGTHYGVYEYYGYDMDWVYNTIVNYSGSSSSLALRHYSYSRNSMKNNIFANYGSGMAAYINTNTNFDADYNNFWAPNNTNLVYWQGNRASLAALKSAYATNNQNSISVDPMLMSNTDLHLTISSPLNGGTPIAGITDDIDGETRSTTVPDMGADEWDPLAHDLFVSEILTPISSVCGSTTDAVKVILKNYGLNTETNVPVYVSIVTPTGTVSVNTIVSSVPSAYNDTITVGTVNTTTPGTYSYTAYPSLATDLNHTNDTAFSTTATDFSLSVPHMEDFTSGPYNWDYDSYSGGIDATHGLTSNALSQNIWSTYTDGYAYLENKIGPIPANAYLTFDYRLVDYGTNTATTLDQDTINLYLSDNCGATRSLVYTIDTNNHVPSATMQKVMIPLTAFVSDDILIQFEYIWNSQNSSHDFWIDIDNVGIGLPPVVSIANDTICAGDTAMIDGGTYAPYNLTYEWFAIGNTTAIGTSQYLSTDSAGTYYVKVMNEYGLMDSDTMVLLVNPAPTVTYAGMNTAYCVDGVIDTLTGTPSAGVFAGAGITGNIFDPATAGVGSHIITYSFANTFGCIGVAVDTAVVNPLPMVSTSPDVVICDGSSTTIKVNGPELMFSEYIEGSSNNKAIELYNSTMDTLNLDNYRIGQAVNGGGWQYYHTFPVGTMLNPGATWVMVTNQTSATYYDTANADEVLAYPSVVHHNGDDARSVEKTMDGGLTWTIIDIIGDPDNDPGSSWPIAGVSGGTANHTLIRKASVYGPNTDWAAVQGTDSISSEYLVYPQNYFTNLGQHTAMAAPVYTYLWSNSGTTAAITVNPTTTTTYTVTVSDGNNCSVVDTVVVTVNPAPVVNLGNDANVCGSESLVLDAGAGYVYFWSDSSTTQTITVDSTGFGLGAQTFWVMVTDTNSGCYSTDTIELTFVAGISVSLGTDQTIYISKAPNSATLDAGAGFASYLWSNSAITQTIQVIGSVAGAGTHTYTVTVTDANACEATDDVDVEVIDDTGINDLDNDNAVTIFPNPTKGMFKISFNGIIGDIDMEIIDAAGRVINSEKLIGVNDGYVKEIDATNLADGIYYVKLMNNETIKLVKLVIQ